MGSSALSFQFFLNTWSFKSFLDYTFQESDDDVFLETRKKKARGCFFANLAKLLKKIFVYQQSDHEPLSI